MYEFIQDVFFRVGIYVHLFMGGFNLFYLVWEITFTYSTKLCLYVYRIYDISDDFEIITVFWKSLVIDDICLIIALHMN